MRSQGGSSRGSNAHERRLATEVQRMPGLSRSRQSQTPRMRETEQPTRPGTIAPCEHDEIGARDSAVNVASGVGPDRIGDAMQLARIRPAVCEERHDLD